MVNVNSIIANSMNAAIVGGRQGLNNASSGITLASINIAQRSAQTTLEEQGPGQVLANASLQGLKNVRAVLPTAERSATDDLVSLKLNSINAQASAKVVDVANDTVGRIIDILA